MQPIESEGRTVAEAVDAALVKIGLRRDQVEVTVLAEGSLGFMGIGAKPARVRLTEKRWGEGPVAASTPAKPVPPQRAPRPAPRQAAPPPRPYIPPPTPIVKPKPAPKPESKPEPRPEPRRQEPRREEPRRERSERPAPTPVTPEQAKAACEKATALVTELLKLMTIAAPTVTAAWDPDLERVKLSVESQDASLLVGRDGRVLESVQFLATLMMGRGSDNPVAVQVDALSYWEKREQAILDEARKGVLAVKADGRPYRLEPMDASMRRLIHRTFANDAEITTGSEGEGPWRKIVIRARKG